MEREILTAHRLTQGDVSPLQFVSAQLLEYYRRCEAELAVLKSQPPSPVGTSVGTSAIPLP